MKSPTTSRVRPSRRGVAAVELALLLPFLSLLFVITLDWARVFYFSIVVDNCTRNGALYAVDPYSTFHGRYTDSTQSALADAPSVTPTPVVVVTNGMNQVTTPATGAPTFYRLRR